MKYSHWIWKEILCLLFLTNVFQARIDGRRYDKCETLDGRQGVCVVKRYCREATAHPLLPCDDDDNFCCPIPTTLRSARQPEFSPPASHSTPNTDSSKNAFDQRQHELYDDKQKPVYSREKPVEDSTLTLSKEPGKSQPRADEQGRRSLPSYPRPREESRPGISVRPDRVSDSGRPRNKGPAEDIPLKAPEDSRRLQPREDENSRRPTTSHYSPVEESRPEISVSPDRVSDSGRKRNKGPVDDFPLKRPDDSKRLQPREEENGRRPATSYHRPVEESRPGISVSPDRVSDSGRNRNKGPVDDFPLKRTDDSKRLQPREEENGRHPATSYHRPVEESRPGIFVSPDRVSDSGRNRNKGSVDDFPLKRPEDSKRLQPHEEENGRRPVTSYHRPVEESQPEMYENRDRISDSGRPRNNERSDGSLDRTQPKGRIRFEGSVPIVKNFPTENSNEEIPRQIFPLEQNDDLRKTQNPSNPRGESSLPDKSRDGGRNDKRVPVRSEPENYDRGQSRGGLQPPSVSRYPSRDQLEVQKLPSNPRRLKPLPYDVKNVTDEEVHRDHVFFSRDSSSAQPKVPACGVKPYDLFIAGGETSEAYEWPWMTAIFRRHQGSRPKTFLCGGSLINNKYVLTAAHCFVNNYVILPASSFVVRLGSHFLDSGEEYTVESLAIHHNHSGSDFFNDIALVRIASEIYITDKIAPICLPTPDMMDQDFVDRIATVAGWGDTAFRTGASRALQHVTLPIVSSDECFAAYSRVRGAAFLARGSDHVICAGLREGGKDACLGDSGGPLMLKTIDDRWMIVGIVSLGYKCAEPGYPGVYTRVTHYLTWIQSNMKTH